MKKILSNIFLGIGFLTLLVSLYLSYLHFVPARLAFHGSVKASGSAKGESPATLIIKNIGVNLPIFGAVLSNNTWQTTYNGVSYLSSTPRPGEKGNSVIYGHNWTSLLGNLTKIKPGQEVMVVMNNGKVRKFRVENTAEVDPSQIQIINPTPDTRLTIYTCTGFLDSKRFVVVAKPV